MFVANHSGVSFRVQVFWARLPRRAEMAAPYRGRANMLKLFGADPPPRSPEPVNFDRCSASMPRACSSHVGKHALKHVRSHPRRTYSWRATRPGASSTYPNRPIRKAGLRELRRHHPCPAATPCLAPPSVKRPLSFGLPGTTHNFTATYGHVSRETWNGWRSAGFSPTLRTPRFGQPKLRFVDRVVVRCQGR